MALARAGAFVFIHYSIMLTLPAALVTEGSVVRRGTLASAGTVVQHTMLAGDIADITSLATPRLLLITFAYTGAFVHHSAILAATQATYIALLALPRRVSWAFTGAVISESSAMTTVDVAPVACVTIPCVWALTLAGCSVEEATVFTFLLTDLALISCPISCTFTGACLLIHGAAVPANPAAFFTVVTNESLLVITAAHTHSLFQGSLVLTHPHAAFTLPSTPREVAFQTHASALNL